MAYLAREGLKHRTIKAYLSGIRCMQIHLSMGNPFGNGAMPRLEYVLTGIKRVESRSGVTHRRRMPITMDIMCRLRGVWLTPAADPDKVMLWAAACTGFFGFLRAGEFSVPSAQAYDPQGHLNLADISVDSHATPSMVCLQIKQSKTDPFRQGVEVFLGRTYAAVCPVEAIIGYIAVRASSPGPLFVLQSGTPLTRSYLVTELQSALRILGLEDSQFNGHSFRIGAATTAAMQGLEDSLIQTLGRWKSEAYRTYIRIPRNELAEVSRVLAQGVRS